MVSQTEQIRQILLKRGIDYSASAVVSELARRGIHINMQMVYGTRSQMKKEKKLETSTSKPIKATEPIEATPQPVFEQPKTTLSIDSVKLNDLINIHQLAKRLGGVEKLQQHIDLLNELANKPATELLEPLSKMSGVS